MNRSAPRPQLPDPNLTPACTPYPLLHARPKTSSLAPARTLPSTSPALCLHAQRTAAIAARLQLWCVRGRRGAAAGGAPRASMTGAAHERQGLLRQTGSLAEEEAFSHKGAAAAADDMAEEWGLYGGNCFGWHLRPAVAESLQLSLFWLLVWGAKLSFATLCLLPTLLSAPTSLVTLFPLSPPVGAAPPYGTRTSRVGG